MFINIILDFALAMKKLLNTNFIIFKILEPFGVI